MAKAKKSKIDKCIKEYKFLKVLYGDFSFTVKFILENLLRKNGYKYQAVTHREKDEKSLNGKLENIKGIKSVQDIDDLAGCRIIFYLDNDIKKIISLLRNEFEVVKQNLKRREKGEKGGQVLQCSIFYAIIFICHAPYA